ncbi:MAG: GDP-mannose 4,6-dehydratase [Candidatus Binatia bacterium]
MRVLVTGVTGFAGTHLAQRLHAEGHEVFGTTRNVPSGDRPPPRPPVSTDHLLVAALNDTARLAEVVRRVRPDALFHLAAFTSPSGSFSDPAKAYRINLQGSLNVFAAVRDAGQRCRIVWVGSSQVYGEVLPDELPVTEANLLRPLSPYAVSKAAADLAAFQWSRTHGLDVVRMRPFNHTGPGQSSQFVCSDFARQIVAIEHGLQPPRISVGNLEVVRDFTDVRDVVRAYVLAWKHGAAGSAYNVCSGVGRTPREILNRLLAISGASANVAVQAGRPRPIEVPALVGSASKLQRDTGWHPTISWEDTLQDLLNDWRQRWDRLA